MSEALPIRVLFVEDDEDVRMQHAQALSWPASRSKASPASRGARAQIVLRRAGGRGLRRASLPGMSGTDWLPRDPHDRPELPVILVTGHGDIAMAVQAMRDGAYDFIEKPFTSERLVAVVRHAVERRAADAAGAGAARAAGELARHPGGADRPLGADAAGAPHRA